MKIVFSLFLFVFLFLLSTIRFYLVIPFLVTLGIMAFFRFGSMARLAIIFGISVICVFSFWGFGLDLSKITSGLSARFLDETIGTNRAIVRIRGTTSYRVYPVNYYDDGFNYSDITFTEWALSFLKGFVFFLLVPFPWMISSKSSLLVCPQMIIWYFLAPFLIMGVIVGLRYKFDKFLPLFLPIFLITVLFSLVEGNAGTAFRHRDMLMPFYIIFSIVGILNFCKNSR